MPIRMTIIKKQEIQNVTKDVEEREHLCAVGRNVNWPKLQADSLLSEPPGNPLD